MNKNILRWFHLSDLHMSAEDLDQREIVFEALWKDISKLIQQHGSPDFIVFSGDISMSCRAHEYDLAWENFFHPLLKLCRKRNDRLFLVPGNHDVSWNTVNSLKNPLNIIKHEDDLRALVTDGKERKLRLQPMDEYKSFFNKYIKGKRKNLDPLFASHWSIKKGNNKISLIGLNSAWLSGYNRKKNNQVYDKNRLAISEYQIRQHLKKCEGASLTVCIHHHPLEWLFDFDAEEVRRWMVKCFDISLRGHLHTSDVFVEFSTMGNLVSIPCGSVFDRRRSPNSYNMSQIDLVTGKGTVYFRRYNDHRAEWQKDIQSTGSELDGKKDFNIIRSVFERSQSRTPQVFSQKQEFFISHTDQFNKDVKKLGLTNKIAEEMVLKEFHGHKSYLYWETSSYPLTIQNNYIVFYSKIGKKVILERAARTTRNQSQLYSWIKITDLYRACTREYYRSEHEILFIQKGNFNRARNRLALMVDLIIKYFSEFEQLTVDPVKREANKRRRLLKESSQAGVVGNSVSAYLSGAMNALGNASMVFTDYKEVERSIEAMVYAGKISPDAKAHRILSHRQGALEDIIKSLEKALSNLHKIITEYPPIF